MLPDSCPWSAPPADEAFRADTRTYLARLEELGFAGVLVVAHDGAPFVAVGPDAFASWDGGQSPSRPLTFTRASDGTMRATFDRRDGAVTAVR